MGCRGKGTLQWFKGYYEILLMGLWEHVELSIKCLVKGPKVRKGGIHVAKRNKPGLIFFLDQSLLVTFHHLIIPPFFLVLLFSVF